MDNTALFIAIGSSILLSSAIPHIVIAIPGVARKMARRQQLVRIQAVRPKPQQVGRHQKR